MIPFGFRSRVNQGQESGHSARYLRVGRSGRRLHEATGRPALTAAAASGEARAFEGYKGHGVFTYALMEALHKGDSNSNRPPDLGKRCSDPIFRAAAHAGMMRVHEHQQF